MTLKKKQFDDDEVAIFDDALIYKRGDYWQMRMWLAKENRYARFSLKTGNKSTAIDRAKNRYHELIAQQFAGKRYFSLNAKQGVEKYLEQRWKDVDAGVIVVGRYKTIKTHLEHWLDFIGRDTKLKDLHVADCENYYSERRKSKRKEELKVSQSTILNEQATINAMMHWLFSNNEAQIEKFTFKKLKKIDTGDLAGRRSAFTDKEIKSILHVLPKYIKEPAHDKNEKNNTTKAIVGCYLGFSIMCGMRRGEMLQMRWSDISANNTQIEHRGKDNKYYDLFYVTVRGETSKVRKTWRSIVRDLGFLIEAMQISLKKNETVTSIYKDKNETYIRQNIRTVLAHLENNLIFSIDGKTAITPRAIQIHFDAVMERAGVLEVNKRGLVPYSFRHTFITQKVNAGLSPHEVGDMLGTSAVQIERTYYHKTKEKMKANALADYKVVNGELILLK